MNIHRVRRFPLFSSSFCVFSILLACGGCQKEIIRHPFVQSSSMRPFNMEFPNRREGKLSVVQVSNKRTKSRVRRVSLRSRKRKRAIPRHIKMRQKIVRIARKSLGRRWVRCGKGIRFRADCSGWIRCIYSRVGIDLLNVPRRYRKNGVHTMYHFARMYGRIHRAKKPFPGDLVYWHYTYDKDKNGLLDDRLTHVGIVEKVFRDGRISILHFSKRVKRIFMDLNRPHFFGRSFYAHTRDKRTCRRRWRNVRYCQKHRTKKSCSWLVSKARRSCKVRRRKRFLLHNDYLVRKSKKGLLYGRLTGQIFANFGTVLHRSSRLSKHQKWLSIR